MYLKPGTLVEVLSEAEVLATLDEDGCLDGLPFMPEMLEFCGRQFRVFKSAHKSCDSTYYGPGRLMRDAVFLEGLRCSGSAHGDCQAECLMFWKTAWLRVVSKIHQQSAERARVNEVTDMWLERRAIRNVSDGEITYRCQATSHLAATKPFQWYDLRVIWWDLRFGNVGIAELTKALGLSLVWRLRFIGVGWRAAMRIYDVLHRAVYGGSNPFFHGEIPDGMATPMVKLDLLPGELVRVKPLEEVKKTLSSRNRNRGLSFNPELVPFCGETHRVARRVTRIIDEKTGRMLQMKGPCIVLEGVFCLARYHPEALLCPRRAPHYFREAWLARVDPHAGSEDG